MKRAMCCVMLVFAFPLFAQESLVVPTYDGALLWQADVEQMLRRMYDDLTRMLMPVRGSVSSRFGRRTHPVFGTARHHHGVDIACGIGSEVRATLAGTVVFAGGRGDYGNLVILRHAGIVSETRYAHLSRVLSRQGQRVAKGALLGYSGATGRVTGPHLHFELYQGKRAVDPERFLPRTSVSATFKEKTSF